MTASGNIEYFADTLLLDKTMKILSSIEDDNKNIIKYAFDISSVLEGAKSSIVSAVQNAGQAPVKTVINLLAPGMFFRLHPVLGLLVTGAQIFGFDIFSIFEKIASFVKEKLIKGESVSSQEINDIAQSVIPNLESESNDLFYGLRILEQEGKITKSAYNVKEDFQKANIANPLLSNKNTPPLLRMLSFLGPRKGGSFIVGVIVWFIKTILLSAGLLAGAGMVAGMVGAKPSTTEPTQPISQTQTSIFGNILGTPSGPGSTIMRKNPKDIWLVGLNGKTPTELLVNWTTSIHPDLINKENIIKENPNFKRAVQIISEDKGRDSIAIPQQFNKPDDILALYIQDVYKDIHFGAQ